jgi:hypothetical protein
MMESPMVFTTRPPPFSMTGKKEIVVMLDHFQAFNVAVSFEVGGGTLDVAEKNCDFRVFPFDGIFTGSAK